MYLEPVIHFLRDAKAFIWQTSEGVPISVIGEQSRVIPRTQMPDNWRLWPNRGMDCGLRTSVWQFLVLPDVPQMLRNCDKPLCNMLKEIITQNSESTEDFAQCAELAVLLEYSYSEATSSRLSFHGFHTMARLMLALSYESDEISTRFKAHIEVRRFCGVRTSRWLSSVKSFRN